MTHLNWTELNSTELNSTSSCRHVHSVNNCHLSMNVVTQLTQFVGRDVINKNTTDLAVRCSTGSVEFNWVELCRYKRSFMVRSFSCYQTCENGNTNEPILIPSWQKWSAGQQREEVNFGARRSFKVTGCRVQIWRRRSRRLGSSSFSSYIFISYRFHDSCICCFRHKI